MRWKRDPVNVDSKHVVGVNLCAEDADGIAGRAIVPLESWSQSRSGMEHVVEPAWYFFGNAIRDMRVWVPGAVSDVKIFHTYGNAGNLTVTLYAFGVAYAPESISAVSEERICTVGDVLAWTQLWKVADQVDKIPMTQFGYVQSVGDFVRVKRISRQEANGIRDSVAVARRVGGFGGKE